MLQKGYKQKQIAEAIGKDKNIVCREIRRNCDARSGAYRYEFAQRKSEKRHQTKPKRILFTEQVKAYVDTWLKNDFSPEQIAGRAKLENVECVSHERIYQNMFGLTKKPKVHYLST
jgi:IS30 family transposase